jgi:hypothetical protein
MIGLIRAPRDIADSIGFGVVFPYMGFAIPYACAGNRSM